jgi:hypothetical protein
MHAWARLIDLAKSLGSPDDDLQEWCAGEHDSACDARTLDQAEAKRANDGTPGDREANLFTKPTPGESSQRPLTTHAERDRWPIPKASRSGASRD